MQKIKPTITNEGKKEGELLILGVVQVSLTILGNVLRYLRILLF